MDSPAKGNSLSPKTDPPETIAAKGVYECLLWIYFKKNKHGSQSQSFHKPLFGKLEIKKF